MHIHDSMVDLVGNTPLVRLNNVTEGIQATVLAKVEYFNPGGSVKDRIALRMIEDAEERGLLGPGSTIVEPTSGNTGVGLAIVAQQKGYKCIFVCPDKVSLDKINVLRAYGAEVVVCPTAVDPEHPDSYYNVSDRLVRETPGAWKPDQYSNPNNPLSHYHSTGPELWEQTDGKITHFVAGIGTGGTANTVFDHQTAPFLGTVGTADNDQMDSIRFVDDTRMDVDPARFHGRDWLIENGSTVDVVAAGTMSSRTFTNAGLLRLDGPDAPENLLSTIGGNYVSEGGTLAMGATSDEAKNFLEIQQAATLGDDGPTTIDLDLSPDWDGDRIDLVRSAAASDAGAFTMTPIPVNNGSFRGTAVLKSEPNEAGGLTWYIEGVPEELYTVVVNNGTLPGGLSTDTFYAGDTVELTADEPAEGMRFTGWRIDSGGPLEGIDLSSPSTTFTMPANDVEVTALYEPVPSPSPTPSPTHPTHSPSHGPGLPETGSSSLTPIALTVGLLALGGLLFLLRRGLKEGRH